MILGLIALAFIVLEHQTIQYSGPAFCGDRENPPESCADKSAATAGKRA
jgi:hypothetical protein